MTIITCALKEACGYLNWVHGGGVSLDPKFHPEIKDRHAFEHCRQAIGGDETCSLVKLPSGLYAAKSPNGRSWLSRQPDGSLQERAVSDPSQPGPWESGPYDASAGTWTPPHGPAFGVVKVGNGPTPPGPSGSFIRAQGHDLVTEDGTPWLFAAYTMHTLPSSAVQGADLEPLLADALALGYTSLVTIGTHLSQWKRDNGFFCDPFAPGYQDALARMFDVCAAHGLYVAHAALADCQGLSLDQQKAVFGMNRDVARGRWNLLFRAGNEDGANGWNGMSLDRPQNMGGVLCSRGSRGIDTPPYNSAWDFVEWEDRRDPVHKAMDDAGAGVLELLAGYQGTSGQVGPFSCPVLQIEPPFFHDTTPDMFGDTRWTDPKLALALGVNIAANAPGGAFGCSNGLVCRPIGNGRARECAEEFLRGLKAGFVR